MRVARVERSALVIVLLLVSVAALKKGGVAVSRVAVRRRINDKSARFGTPGPPNVEDMETRCGRNRTHLLRLCDPEISQFLREFVPLHSSNIG